MPIDIDKLTETELIDLNHRIVARLRLLHQVEAHEEMLEFRIGERVRFQPEGRPPVVGMITEVQQEDGVDRDGRRASLECRTDLP